jgi:hypothetical protein
MSTENDYPYEGNKVVSYAPRHNARNLTGTKVQVNHLRFVSTKLDTVIDARWWMGKARSASIVYCSVWINPPGHDEASGYGTAGGYGYHKESAALEEAFESAGLKFAASFGGGGDHAMRKAIEAVAAHFAIKGKII